MDMEEKQAQKTAEPTAENGANAGTVTDTHPDTQRDAETDSVNEAAFEDSLDGTEKNEDADKGLVQSREQNRENARRRREAERQKELRAERDKAIISTLRGKNPYTQEEMKDSADVEEYLSMREIEDNGGDPVADYSKHLKEKERNAKKEAEETAKKEEWYRKDLESFSATHPHVKVEELISDKYFRAFADGKVGNVPLTKIYSDFLDFVSGYEEKAMDKAAQMLANQKATPGSLGHTQEVESDFFSYEQVRKMSQEEVRKNYDKIMESRKKW